MSDEGGDTVTAHVTRFRARSSRFVEITSAGTPPVLRIREGVIRIGREAGNEIVIEDPFISRSHLEVRVLPQGVEVVDLDTKNGTHFQGARIRTLPVTSEVQLLLGRQCTVKIRVSDDAREAEERKTAGPQAQETLDLVGESASANKLRSAISRVAPTQLTVLIEGETGAGKDVVARAIHSKSPRAGKPLIVFDCGAVAPTLIASELFGHTKGAYTGATSSSEGAFRRAQGSTLFLDEIGELPLELQPALLRALEARQVKPVGSDQYVSVDVRVIAATNRSLEAEVEAGRFRKDLLFRLAVTRIKVPPLRARPEDVPILAQAFALALGATLSPQVLDELSERPWPGNVRELKNTVERAVMFAGGEGSVIVSLGDDEDDDDGAEPVIDGARTISLAPEAGQAAPVTSPGTAMHGLIAAVSTNMTFQDAKQAAVDSFEREYLMRLFVEADYNLSEAARRSGVDRRYLRELFKKHGIDLAQMRASKKG